MSMKCPRCHHENPEHERSCIECGMQLDMIDKIPIIHTEDLEKPVEKHHQDAEDLQSDPKDIEQEIPTPESELSQK